MMQPADRPRKLPRFVRIIRARPRLFLSACLGLAVIVSTPGAGGLANRLIIGWDIGVALYLVLAIAVIAKAGPDHIRRRAALQDEGSIAILVLTTVAALASLGAILVELGTADKAGRDALHLALAALTIALSWGFTHTIFALHYANEFYTTSRHDGRGLTFPGNDEPDYWDFLYFSLVIGMTSQVSDVAVTAKRIRRTVMAHGVVSFVFNTSLLALAVNIAASAL